MSTHHTPGELKVKIKLPAGLIETRTHDGDDTIVEIEPLDDREASRQAVEKALEELRGNELVIEVPEHSRFGFRGGDAQVRVTVDAPKGAHISTAHGVRRRPAARGAWVRSTASAPPAHCSPNGSPATSTSRRHRAISRSTASAATPN